MISIENVGRGELRVLLLPSSPALFLNYLFVHRSGPSIGFYFFPGVSLSK